MSNVMNKTTKAILNSVHTPDYPKVDWLINPTGLEAAKAIPSHYRVIDGNSVREATKAEKAIIDAGRLPDIKESRLYALCDQAGLLLKDQVDKAAGDIDTALVSFVKDFKDSVVGIRDAADSEALAAVKDKLDSTAIEDGAVIVKKL